MIALLLVVVTLVSAYLWMQQRFGYFRRRGIAHAPPLPIVGNLWGWKFTKHTSEMLSEIYQKYKHTGPLVGFYFTVFPAYIVTDMELLKRIMIKDFGNFDSRGLFYNEHDDPLSAHLFAVDGEKWHSLRPRLSPTFSGAKMKNMFSTIVKTSEELANVMAERCGAAAKSVEITKLLACYTSDTIAICAFGLESNGLRNPQAPFVRMGLKAMLKRRYAYMLCLMFPKLGLRLHIKKTPGDVESFYMGLVHDTIAYREKHNIKRNDFMDMLLELKHKYDDGNTKEGLTVDELAAQAYVFLVAGFETTATALSLALYELARHQHIQQKLRSEIEAVLALHNNELSYDAVQQMKYLDQVISETLRKYPVATEHLRRANAYYQLPDNPRYYLPAGAHIIIPVYSIHHDPAYYPEPNEFRPERFTDEAIQQRPSCAYLPFGLGPRICIGMRFAKLIVSIGLISQLRRLSFKMAPDTPDPILFDKHSFLLHTKDIRLCIEPLQLVN